MLSRYSTDFSFRNIILILFYLSGIGSLVYPFVGIRYFLLLFGNTANATTIFIPVYLFGIVIGVFFGGRYIDKKWYELKHFMLIELIIGAYVIVLFFVLNFFPVLYQSVYMQFINNSIATISFNAATCFILLFPLTVLTGAKFSILGRYLIRSDNIIAQEIGMLHSCHLFGASLGCMLTVILIFLFGVKFSVFIIPVLNFLNSLTVKILLEKFAHPQKLVSEFYDQKLKYFSHLNDRITPFLKNFVFIINGITGLITMAYITLLFKQILFIPSSNLFVQGVVFAFIVVSIAAGSYLSAKFVSEDSQLFLKLFIFYFIVAVFIVITVIYHPKIIIFNQKLWLQQYQKLSYLSFLDTILIIIIPLISLGMLFPIMFKIYLIRFNQVGKNVGNFYSIYIIGLILGFMLTVYFFNPFIGTTKSILTLAAISFLITIVFLFEKSSISFTLKMSYLCFILLIIFSIYAFFPDFLEVTLNNNERIIATRGTNTLFTVNEDAESNRLLKVDGNMIAGTNLADKNSAKLLAHLPILLHENPTNVFISGYGSGDIPWMISRYSVDNIDCSEICNEIIDLSEYFVSENKTINDNPNFNILHTDAVSYMRMTDKEYDAIIINYIQPQQYKNYIFYNKDFFESCSAHLDSTGVIAINIPLINFSFEKFRILINTLHNVFDHVSLWYNNNYLNYNAVLIGSAQSDYKFNYASILNKLNNESIAENLKDVGLADVYEILDCYILGPENLALFNAETKINSFNYPEFSFTTITQGDREFDFLSYLQFLNKNKESFANHLSNVEVTGIFKESLEAVAELYYKSSNNIYEGLICELKNEIDLALIKYRMAFQTNNRDYSANRFINSYYDPMLTPVPETPFEFAENAKIYYQKMDYQKAIEMYNEAIKLDKRYAPAYFGLGINYEVLKDYHKAKRMYWRTLRLKPKSKEAKERLDNILKLEKELKDKVKRGRFIK